jgi:hypothetical protein
VFVTEAAWVAARTPGPLRAFWERTARRRGEQIATIAVAHKLVLIARKMLSRDDDYAFKPPAALSEKIRRLELLAGAQARHRKRRGARIKVSPQRREAVRELPRQAKAAYDGSDRNRADKEGDSRAASTSSQRLDGGVPPRARRSSASASSSAANSGPSLPCSKSLSAVICCAKSSDLSRDLSRSRRSILTG